MIVKKTHEWSMEHGVEEFRIAKLGTRPKGGSPKGNFNLQQMRRSSYSSQLTSDG